jgi:hypothetical protein
VNLPTPRVTRYSTTFLVRLLGLLGDVGKLQVWRKRMSVNFVPSRKYRRREHTGGEALLKLLGLVGVLEHQGVEVLLAADLELDVVGLGALLDPRGYWRNC